MTPSRSIRLRLVRFLAMDTGMKALVLEAVLCLAAARLALVFVPFPVLAKRLGAFVPPGDPRVPAASGGGDARAADVAIAVRRAVSSAARHAPFKAVCLPQAIAAQFMLRRRGVASVMHFGAGKGSDKPLDAHAWLDAAGVKVTGYPISSHLAEIACFV